MSVKGVSKELLKLCAGEPISRVNTAKIDSKTYGIYFCDKAQNRITNLKGVISNGKLRVH